MSSFGHCGGGCNDSLWRVHVQLPLLPSPHSLKSITTEMLVGCVNCNRWGRPDDENFILQLMDEDIEALRAASDEGQS
jgi:hypothetical protein